MFIELTDEHNKKALVNVTKIETVRYWGGKTKITFNAGFIIVQEDYDVVWRWIFNE